jgi:hypothetical protein
MEFLSSLLRLLSLPRLRGRCFAAESLQQALPDLQVSGHPSSGLTSSETLRVPHWKALLHELSPVGGLPLVMSSSGRLGLCASCEPIWLPAARL